MPKTTYTIDADLNKKAPAQDTKIEFTTYYGKPRMLMTTGSHIMEINLTKDIIAKLQELTGENTIMPNWTYNTIIGKKSILQKYVAKNEDYFDFNKLIPMPKSLNIESGSDSYNALIALAVAKPEEYEDINRAWKTLNMFNKNLKQEDRYKEALANEHYKENTDFDTKCALGQTLLNNYKSYGACDWYAWRCEHWGTKWNSANCYIEDYGHDLLRITFDTAWAPPTPLFDKLCDRYPNDNFLFEWQNEDGYETHYFAMSHDTEIYSIDEEYSDDESYNAVNEDDINKFRKEMLTKAGL